MSLIEVLKSGNYKLIDVREPLELDVDGFIDGAVNIPLGEVVDRKDEILSIEGLNILCIGGADSVDRMWREWGISWWNQERITDSDVKKTIEKDTVIKDYRFACVKIHEKKMLGLKDISFEFAFTFETRPLFQKTIPCTWF